MPQKTTQREHLLHRITHRIRRSLELQEILATTVREIRLFLGVDRVKVYRFEADGSGEVMAESVRGDRLPSLLGLHFPAEDIPSQAREMFVKARCRVIVDVVHQQKTLSQLDAWETGECLDVEKVRYASVDPCHVEYLLSMGVSASLSVPILHRDRLWGLLVAHHGESYQFKESQLQIVQLLVDQVSIAIAQSELLVQAKEQARREALTHRISSLLYTSLHNPDLPQSFLEEIARAFGGCGARLYLTPEPLGMPAHTYTYGEQPTEPFIEETAFWQEKIQTMVGQGVGSVALDIDSSTTNPAPSPDYFSGIPHPCAVRCLRSDRSWKPLATAFASTAIRSMLVIPLQYRHQCVGYLSVFRAGCDREVVWAGQSNLDRRNGRPRQSFAAWREVQTNLTQEWSDSDLKLAQALGMHLYVAIMQRRIATTIGHQASHDPLTNLPNRLLFDQQLSLALPLARQRGELLAVAFLDLDRFKTVNDTLSHAVGDRLLQSVTERLRGCVRKYDSVARWGGDEFTFTLGKVNSVADADECARRILDSLSVPFCIDDRELYITGSLGIAIAPYDGEDAQTLLKNADLAMHQAKQRGRNNYRFYSKEMHAEVMEQFDLEADLRKALSRGEFLLHYQPQIDLRTGEVLGFEALIRWQHPKLGLVPPAQFISLAEETDLICHIGEWVLWTVCRQQNRWQQEGLPTACIAANLSARQFQQPNLIQTLVQILNQTGTNPQYLEIEITESTAMRDKEATLTTLKELQGMGVRIAMDDFGTGYSSLSFIKHFPLHTIKIDRSFVRDLIEDPTDAAIAGAVVTLGQGLNLRVLAEGVETREQLAVLQRMGCDSGQGYLFSKPLPAEAVGDFLRTWQQTNSPINPFTHQYIKLPANLHSSS